MTWRLQKKNTSAHINETLFVSEISIRFTIYRQISLKIIFDLHLCYQSYDFAYAMLTQLAELTGEDHRLAYQAVLAGKDTLEVKLQETHGDDVLSVAS